MKELPSNAFSIKWKGVFASLVVAMITAAVASLAQALGINLDGSISVAHMPTKVDLIKSLVAGLAAGVSCILHKFAENSVPSAQATVEEAQAKVVAKSFSL